MSIMYPMFMMSTPTELLQKIDSVKEQLQRLQEDLKRIKDLLKDKQEREGYDAVYQHGSTSETHQTL